jgi:hypothetical protein
MKDLRERFIKLGNAFIVAAALVTLGLSATAGAAGNGGNGMRVSPVRTDLVMKPGTRKSVSVFVQNVTSATTTYKVIENDFIASTDESGSPALLLNGETNDQHGLKRYLTTVDKVTVAAGKQKEIQVNVSIPKGTPGGGYYGAVRFAPIGANGTANVTLSGSVASLILVKVPGDVTEKMSLASFDARQNDNVRTIFTTNKNISAVVRFQNEGDVQEAPFGKVVLKKGGKVLGTYEINGGSLPGNVLPDSIRKFDVPLKGIGSFGKYKLEGNFGYGSSGQLLSASTTFYVIPVWIILLVVIIVLLILFLIFVFPKMVKNYNRNVVRKASRRR